jgi:hypothetical protein
MTVSNGTGTYQISSQSGLPAGLTASIKAGKISFTGTPTTAGTYPNATITVTDSRGAAATVTFGITINAAPTVGTLTEAAWTVNETGFTGTMAVSGGTGALKILSKSGVPAGLTLSLSGNTLVFTGKPKTAGNYTSGSVTLVDAVGAKITRTFAIKIDAAPTISTLTKTAWTQNTPGVAGTMTITAGTGPFTLVSQTNVPPGLTVSITGTTIHFSGTPTTAGKYTGSVTVRDAAGASVMKAFTITVNAPVSFTLASLPDYTVGKAYSEKVAATGGTGAFTLNAVLSGPLPTGLKLTYASNKESFTISGTPTTSVTVTITVTATDSVGAQTQMVYTLMV